jgi:hypothetical protein
LGIFAGGIALNLTPCVYPLIPITVSYFGGKTGQSQGKLLIHGVCYIGGLSVTNSLLGVTAALTGGLMGAMLQSPFVLGLLTWVAGMGNPWFGFLIFFTLSIGLGLPLFFLAMFNHGNIRIPLNFDHMLRYFVVTPDMHRVHHSVIIRETNSNYGFNLPWWDRLFGTYCAQPSKGHIEMTIGLSQFRNIKHLMFHHLPVAAFYRCYRQTAN